MARYDEQVEALRLASLSEDRAVAFIETRRWGSHPKCPKCGAENVYAMSDRASGERERNFRWRCRHCKQMFSARTGTVMEESRLPMRYWVHAFWRACASKKGISALQLSRELSIDYKSALFMLHRVRAAMSDWNDPDGPAKLRGTVEADETYVGGKPKRTPGIRGGTYGRKPKGRGSNKAPVFGMVERGGDLRMRPITRVNSRTLLPILRANVDLASRLCTDSWSGYRGAGRLFARGHHSVSHVRGEYARGDVHSNTIESAFALLKRGIVGTFHNVSHKHLGRYCDEFSFRWNWRQVPDAARVEALIVKSQGKRLTYRGQTSGLASA